MFSREYCLSGKEAGISRPGHHHEQEGEHVQLEGFCLRENGGDYGGCVILILIGTERKMLCADKIVESVLSGRG
ncbi:hypothetical protein QC761_0113910 [Podospora bellae-mahoneyi]|uniref:Uncharacterized protein n=1 Tax=Podospora bellae-mahoneyi TaxID=2093777 RepID=A0ABR0F9K7_9PEZI|nr:hypothetical protein QC761_0113910 [Podospora bellae-mahoneyi]